MASARPAAPAASPPPPRRRPPPASPRFRSRTFATGRRRRRRAPPPASPGAGRCALAESRTRADPRRGGGGALAAPRRRVPLPPLESPAEPSCPTGRDTESPRACPAAGPAAGPRSPGGQEPPPPPLRALSRPLKMEDKGPEGGGKGRSEGPGARSGWAAAPGGSNWEARTPEHPASGTCCVSDPARRLAESESKTPPRLQGALEPPPPHPLAARAGLRCPRPPRGSRPLPAPRPPPAWTPRAPPEGRHRPAGRPESGRPPRPAGSAGVKRPK
eukprot:XP_022265201.1 basic salivary proline-rich protein 1-like [Canis lupus familiaris]